MDRRAAKTGEGLRRCSDLFLGFGGHRHAAGLSLKPENIAAFTERFDQAMGEIPADDSQKPLTIEASAPLDALTVTVLEQFESLGPFGPGNPEPVIALRAHASGHRVMKERHLKLDLVAEIAPRQKLEAVWFFGLERIPENSGIESLSVDAWWAGVPEINRFRGKRTPTLRVRDWKAEFNATS